jgi:hypothetical protein
VEFDFKAIFKLKRYHAILTYLTRLEGGDKPNHKEEEDIIMGMVCLTLNIKANQIGLLFNVVLSFFDI